MRQPNRTLSDLRPNATMTCYYCGQVKTTVGAQKFRAHLVCADCTKKLQAGTGPAKKS